MSEMQVTTEDVEYCKVKVNYVADSKVVSKKAKDALNEIRSLPVPGFRPGKATDTAIKLKYKDRINQWVSGEMLNHAHDDILFETKIKPLGRPQLLNHSLKNNEFSCELMYLKKPEFELKQFKEIEVSEPNQSANVDEIADDILLQLRKKHASSVPYGESDFVQMGDKITLSYQVGEDPIKEGQLYIVGEKLLPEFDENLQGMTAGETRTFNVLINDKPVSCTATVHMGMKLILAPLDDELAKLYNLVKVGALMNTINSMAQQRVASIRNEGIGNQIKEKLVSDHDFEVPPWLVLMEGQYLAMTEGLKWDDLTDEVKDKYLDRAKQNVKFTLILDSIRDTAKESELSDSECVDVVKQQIFRQKPGINVNSAIQEMSKTGALAGLVAKTKNDFTLQYLVDNAIVK
jgi:FKBP-type peptidyl-prolyl cis-trans isomerase (trigger factor)